MTSTLPLITIIKGTTHQLLASIQSVPSLLSPCNSGRHYMAPYDVNNALLPVHAGQHKWENYHRGKKGGLDIKFLGTYCRLSPPSLKSHSSHSDRSDTRLQPVPQTAHTRKPSSHASIHPARQPGSQPACLPARSLAAHPVEGRPVSKSQGWHLAFAAAARFCYSSVSILPPDCLTPMKNNCEPRE